MGTTGIIIVTILAFIVAAAPLLIDNLRHGRASNRNNGLLLTGGLILAAVGYALGWFAFSPRAAMIGGGLAALLLLAGALNVYPAGIMKTMVALLPWFTTSQYWVMLIAGMVMPALLTIMRRRGVAVVPWLAAIALLIWLTPPLVSWLGEGKAPPTGVQRAG